MARKAEKQKKKLIVGVGLAERIAYKPVNQVDPGSNPTRGNRLKSNP